MIEQNIKIIKLYLSCDVLNLRYLNKKTGAKTHAYTPVKPAIKIINKLKWFIFFLSFLLKRTKKDKIQKNSCELIEFSQISGTLNGDNKINKQKTNLYWNLSVRYESLYKIK